MLPALRAINLLALSAAVHACVKLNGLQCSNHGTCKFRECHCYDGYFGPACSKRRCPVGPAWSSTPYLNEKAHESIECSGRGHCDYLTGQCACKTSFGGSACQKRLCPGSVGQCNGRGECLSLGEYSRKVYNLDYSDVWDAEQIYGCHCGEGFEGYDCSLRKCPHGDDPHTGDQVDEVQYIRCSISPSIGTPTSELTPFFIGFGGVWSDPIFYDDYISEVEKKLEDILGLGELRLENVNSACPTICCGEEGLNGNLAADGYGDTVQVTGVTFLQKFGDLEPLRVSSDGRLDVSIACKTSSPQFQCAAVHFTETFQSLAGTANPAPMSIAVTGTKEDLACSGRGECGSDTGFCSCHNAFKSSDGRGHEGSIGDCGWEDMSKEIFNCDYDGDGVECTGHGVCSSIALGAVEFYCLCYDGWTSYDCGDRTCPFGKAWFGPTILDEDYGIVSAHHQAECSNRGVCDRITAQCTCEFGLTGSACDKMECPMDDNGLICSGHGVCHNMASLANLAEFEGIRKHHEYGSVPMSPFTWDHDQIFGCVCDEGYDGIDCSFLTCPRGDNHLTEGVPEKQMLTCATYFNSCFKEHRDSLLVSTAIEDHEYFETALVECDGNVDCYAIVETGDEGSGILYTLYSEDVIQAAGDGTGSLIFAKEDCFVQMMFDTEYSEPLPVDASAKEVEDALRSLNSLKHANVKVTMSNEAGSMCPCAPESLTCTGSSMTNEITVTFPRVNGDLPRVYAFVNTIEVTKFQLPTHKLYDMGDDCRARKGRSNLVVAAEFNMIIDVDVPVSEHMFVLEGDIFNTQLRIRDNMEGAERYFLEATFNECVQYCACHVDCVAFSREVDVPKSQMAACWMKSHKPVDDVELVYRGGWATWSDFEDCCDADQFSLHIAKFGSASFCEENEYAFSETCVKCSPGKTRSAGDDQYGPDTECSATLCLENQYVDDNTCQNCTEGSTNPAGADSSGADTICEGFVCVDSDDGIFDADGDNCLLYDAAPEQCGEADDDDFIASIVCCSCKICPDRPVIENMDTDTGPPCTDAIHGETCEFVCLSGYTASAVATCSKGAWDEQTCVLDARRLTIPYEITQQHASHGRRVDTLYCDAYVFSDGITGGSLDPCSDGVILEENTDCRLNCLPGYTESDGSSLLSCPSDAGAAFADITCTENLCDSWTFNEGMDRASTETDACTDGIVLSAVSDNSCKLSCALGFIASGEAQLTCGLEGNIAVTEFSCDAAITNPSGIRVVSLTLQDGTFEDAICSDRGICQRDLGTCACFSGYTSSDGRGEYGLIPDCGYYKPYQDAVVD